MRVIAAPLQNWVNGCLHVLQEQFRSRRQARVNLVDGAVPAVRVLPRHKPLPQHRVAAEVLGQERVLG